MERSGRQGLVSQTEEAPLERGRRQRSRLRIRLPLRLITRTDTTRAILIDLSLEGAAIQCDPALPVGREVVLEWGGFEAFGEVVWSRGNRCGIAFIDPISPDVLLTTREMDDAAHLPSDGDIVRQTARHWVEGSTRL